MALTKSVAAITQLTASGTSTALDVHGSYSQFVGLRHYNGTSGTPTTAATMKIQVEAYGGARYYDLCTVTASLVATQVDLYTIAIPDGAGSIQIVYTQPSGGSVTGFTLDAEVGTITAL